jgi:DNA primase catalytic core
MMRVKIRDLERVIEDVKLCLPDYLADHGHEQKRRSDKFRCPNEGAHKHGDRDPSATFVPGSKKTVWHCFACGERGNVFHAAYWLENMPIKGSGFIDTLLKLADQYHIRYEEDVDAEKMITAMTRATEIAQKGRESKKAEDYIKSRGLEGVAEHFEFGYVNHEKFVKLLTNSYDSDFLAQVGLTKKALFHDRLIFPIRDADGEIVAFASRRINDTDETPKYLNSSANRLYEKGKLLYNLHSITGDEVWVVEGYADVWTMTLNGLPAVAAGGTAFTFDHFSALVERGIKKMTLCLDGDFAGVEATKKILPMLENQLDIQVSIVMLPATDDEKDPDAYIRKHGVEAFLALPHKTLDSPVKVELSKFPEQITTFDDLAWESKEHGYKSLWPYFEEQLDGFKRGLWLVGGLSNIGKTHFLVNWMKGLAISNPDLHVLFFSIDDNMPKIIPRLMASEAMLPINMMSDPNKHIVSRYEDQPDIQQELLNRRNMALASIYDLAKKNFTVKDDSEGNTLEFMEKTISLYKQITGKPLAVFIDNFHKIRAKGFRNPLEKFTFLSEEIKRITNQYDLLVGATVELRKLNHKGRPSLDDIKESADIVYDADMVLMLHNDLHSKGDNSRMQFTHRGSDKPYPILEVDVAKNKLSSFKGRNFFRLYPEWAKVTECDQPEREMYAQILKDELAND